MDKEEKEMTDETFARVFFPLYDKKIATGEITYRELGMPQNDFMLLCTTSAHVPETEVIERLIDRMHLTEEEAAHLRAFEK